MELHFHSVIRFLGMVLNCLSPVITLPFILKTGNLQHSANGNFLYREVGWLFGWVIEYLHSF